MPTRIKICGITRSEDLKAAVDAGADAIGLVFYAKSPRNVSIAQAAELLSQLPPFVTSVALFMNAKAEFVQTALDELPLDLLQFHGNESRTYCEHFSRPYIKAVPMKGQSPKSVQDYIAQHPKALGYLVDSHAPNEAGGSGKTFDWQQLATLHINKPIILAGGLNPENVATAVAMTQVYAVDVSSGVEANPGIKAKDKLYHFVQEVRRVE